MTPVKVIECDTTSVAKCLQKIDIWEDIKSGKIVRTVASGTVTQDPDERIMYWTGQRDMYVKRLESYGAEALPQVSGFLGLLEKALPFIVTIAKKIFNL